MNTTIERDERDVLSDSHRDYMLRYIQFELERQEKVSDRFLRERSHQSKRAGEAIGMADDARRHVSCRQRIHCKCRCRVYPRKLSR